MRSLNLPKFKAISGILFLLVFFSTTISAQEYDAYSFNFQNGKTNAFIISDNIFADGLYIGWATTIKLFSPKYGEKFDPEFDCEGCRTIWHKDFFDLTVIPDSLNYKIKVFQKGKLLEELKGRGQYFRPIVGVYFGGKRLEEFSSTYNISVGVQTLELRSEGLSHSFTKYRYKNEGIFKVTEVKASLIDRSGVVYKSKFYNTSVISIYDLLESAKVGMILRMEVNDISRLNYDKSISKGILPQNSIIEMKIVE